MSKLPVQKVTTPKGRTLPIFDEFEDIANRIRVRAYNLFKSRGFSLGQDLDDWLAAEREICWPAAELVEEDDEFEVKVELAGFEPEDISVTATPRELMIKASREDRRKGAREYGEGKVRWSEFRGNDVYRRIELPEDVDVNKITAELEHGILEIEAPKVLLSKPARKKVTVTEAKTTAAKKAKKKASARKQTKAKKKTKR